jgi:hypothetical protein
MDERLQKALEISNLSTIIKDKKRLLKEQFYDKIVIYKNGGIFTISPELINFTQNLLNREVESVILIDDNELPVNITDLDDFVSDIYDVYFSATNKYFQDYQELIKNRSAEKIINV